MKKNSCKIGMVLAAVLFCSPILNSTVLAADTGYHIDYHSYGCTQAVCTSWGGGGRIDERNMGQMWEPCQACVNQGRPNNDLFIMEWTEQYYVCSHYPEGIALYLFDGRSGVYRRGQCQYNMGWAKLDTRVSQWSHDYYYCPGHKNPNTYTLKYNSNGGTGQMANSVHTYNIEQKLAKNMFRKAGFRFLGWSKKQNQNKPDFVDMQMVKNLTSENGAIIILYAVWEDLNPNPPTIQAEDIFIHMNDTDTPVNEELLLSKVKAEDKEDGNITDKIIVKNLDEVIAKASQAWSHEEIDKKEKIIEIQYSVKDSGGKIAETKAALHIIYPVVESENQGGYIRFVEKQYVDDIPADMTWFDKKELLKTILNKSTENIVENKI